MMVSVPPVIMGSTSTPASAPGELLLEAAHRAAHLVGAVQVQFDCACVGLVEQARNLSLDDHVAAQAGRRLDCRVGGPPRN